MRQITSSQLAKFLAFHEPPCLSIYLPTHRFPPDHQQDPIRYRNLLRESKDSLLRKYPAVESSNFLSRFEELAHDDAFWNHRTDGLALLGSSDRFQIFELARAMPELVVVADSFHVKPLLRVLQSADRFQILALNRHEARLFEGNRDVLDEVDIDNHRFFRAIDQAILEHHSRPSGLPLMLAALPEHHDLFRKVSHNPFLMDAAIGLDSGAISEDHLREEAWRALAPKYQERLAKLVDQFEEAQAKQRGSADLTDIAQALKANRVGMLLVEAGRQIPGRLDTTSGRVEFADLTDPDVDDLLDDLAELALKLGGEVVVVPTERMPSSSGAAATYRF